MDDPESKPANTYDLLIIMDSFAIGVAPVWGMSEPQSDLSPDVPPLLIPLHQLRLRKLALGDHDLKI